jgi:hypothetical protein
MQDSVNLEMACDLADWEEASDALAEVSARFAGTAVDYGAAN